MKTALYIRVSTDSQAERGHSIEAQKDKLRAFCALQDIQNYEEYIDPGYTASNLNRPAIKRLIQDIKLGLIDAVIVYKLDRLSRRTKDTLHLVEDIFIKNNVKFISLSENIDTSTSSGKFFLSILSSVAQLERENIKERSILGRKKQAEMGIKERTPRILIGYDYDEKSKAYIINEYEAMQVRMIYDEYLKGTSLGDILKKLQSYTTKYGKWTELRSIQHILDNESYTGKFWYGGCLYEAKNVPPIISDTLFEEVSKKRAYFKEHYYRHTSGYLLTGLIYCGICGARLRGYSKAKNKSGKVLKYYACYTRLNNPRQKHMRKADTCDLPYIGYTRLNNTVEKELFAMLGNKNIYESNRNITIVSNAEEIEILSKEIKGLNEKAERIMDLLIDAEIDKDTFLLRLNDINSQKEVLEKKLHSLKKAQIEVNPLPYEEVQKLIEFYKSSDLNNKRAILAQLIKRITINSDKTIKIEWLF